MKALKFVLRGKTAFFKNPEVNSYYYFTFGQIHKPVLLGIFGAIMGYNGYGIDYKTKKIKYEDYPEYYEKLKDIKIAVVPNSKNGYFSKKIQSFNNSVGYASKEVGGNLIVKEQWLENPSWTIYLSVSDEISEELAKNIYDRKCVYVPYLGKNDHPAIIEEISYVELKEVDDTEVQSLIPSSYIEDELWEYSFKYEEYLPIELKLSTNNYILEKFCFTDCDELYSNEKVWFDGERNVVFF